MYLAPLGSTLGLCDATLFVWYLMSNHVHLVVRAGVPLEERQARARPPGDRGGPDRGEGLTQIDGASPRSHRSVDRPRRGGGYW